MRGNPLHELRDRPGGRVPAPGDARVLGHQDLDEWSRPRFAFDKRDRIEVTPGREPAPVGIGIGQRRGKRRTLQPRCQRLEPCQRKRQQIATLARREGMDLVDHNPAQAGKHLRRFGIAQQQRERFGRRQQHMRGPGALAGLAIRRRVAAARLDADRQLHVLDRGDQVALNVMRQRLERRDVQRVQPFGRRRFLQPRRCEVAKRGQETCERLARAGIGNEQGMVSGIGGLQHLGLVAPHAPVAACEPRRDLRGYCLLGHPLSYSAA
ncbi:hypothetical protein MBENS4_0977 [Novosphingobium sp. MBES04]|nr:hypothetical protein MBENS4_0977 [Novosphingobium sp. MBES04]